jgi:glycosyltransferase involved in cell wall biosynthesis
MAGTSDPDVVGTAGPRRTSEGLVRVDPRFAPEHAAYYLRGILQRYSVPELPLSRSGFPDTYTDNKPLAFVLRRGAEERNIYIAADDMPELDPVALEWADVYGKVNLEPSLVPPEGHAKVIPIGPSHALRLWDARGSLRMAWRTARLGGKLTDTREHYRRFWLQTRRRLDDLAYEPEPAQDAYVFYNGWLWAKHPEANAPRAEFMRVCRSLAPAVDFEGGFQPRRRNDVPEYDDVIADRRYTLVEYLERIKRSTVVFNNPAAHHCLGWKLAEFLRLGKAIVTLPLSREMPAPIVHGEHVHVVDGTTTAIRDAVLSITSDAAYRRRLEQGARGYYLEHLAADRVIERLATTAFSSAHRPAS